MVSFIKDTQKREFDSTGQVRAVQFAFVNTAAGGNTQVIAAQAGLRIVVLNLVVITATAQSVKFQSATSDISCAWPLATNGGLVLPYSRHGWFQTNIDEALNVNLSGAINTAVQLAWIPSL